MYTVAIKMFNTMNILIGFGKEVNGMLINKFPMLISNRLLKVSEISQATGISRTTLTSLYYRRTKRVDLDTLNKICCYLKCDVSDIFEYREEEQETKKKLSR